MLTWNEIMEKTTWVAKMQGWRATGTYKEIGCYADDEDCRDFDICAKQPTEELQKFWDAHTDYIRKHGWMLAEDFYNTVYAC